MIPIIFPIIMHSRDKETMKKKTHIDEIIDSAIEDSKKDDAIQKMKKDLDEVLEEYIKNAPPINGFTIKELAESDKNQSVQSCPTCGRPYNKNVKF